MYRGPWTSPTTGLGLGDDHAVLGQPHAARGDVKHSSGHGEATVSTTTFENLRALPIGPRTRAVLLGLGVFAFAFIGYYFAGPTILGHDPFGDEGKPINWLNFYVHLAEAMTHGTFDLTSAGLTGAEHPDLFVKDGEVYLPYGPTPALLLIPSVLIFGMNDTTQWFHSMVLGAFNVALFWYVLRLLKTGRATQFLLVPFFAFGTVNFYCATTGTIWFYNHTTAVTFVFLAIIFLLRGPSPILAGISLGLALFARQPAVLAVPAFVYFMVRQRHPDVFDLRWLKDPLTLRGVILFGAGVAPFVFLFFVYNAVRFGDIFDTGLGALYDKYNGLSYTLYLEKFPGSERFGEFDWRNIPLHLYTIFLLPPTFTNDGSLFQPSPYGMSAVLTSSPFVYAFLVRKQSVLRNACWIAIPSIAVPTLLYYSQGWVQFGYRYLMDYLPFLMILTALGFEENQSRTSVRIMVVLVIVSVAIGFWGRYWGTRLGW